MPNMQTMPIMQSDNAECAHNAIYASQTTPNMQTMPIVHTMPFLTATQCQICTQCHLCSTFGIRWLHIWHCMGAQLALGRFKIYRHSISVLLHPCGWSCARLFENILSIGLEKDGLENKVLVTVLLKILVLSEPSEKMNHFWNFL